MTRLFIRFYIGVLVVLFLAWSIYGTVLKRRTERDRDRVVTEAHRGGARLAAEALDEAGQHRDERLRALQSEFAYPLEIVAVNDLPEAIRRRLTAGEEVLRFRPPGGGEAVLRLLAGQTEAIRLGPFPDYGIESIEDSIAGWMRLAAAQLNAAPADQQQRVLQELGRRFDFPLALVTSADLPQAAQARLTRGDEVVFYPSSPKRWSSVIPLSSESKVLRFGPFPSFERADQQAATATLALVLLPTAIAIALLLRPVARQLRDVEEAAKAIAAGDLSARVDERRVPSTKTLARSFNQMASRTETVVRTQRELMQAVSHELRTPLSRIRFAIDLIGDAKNDAERQRRLSDLDDATEELDSLVGELLRYVRLETAELPSLEREIVAVRDVLEGVIPKYRALHGSLKFHIAIGGESKSDAPVTVFADRVGFQRALGNLLSNASRFASSEVVIHVTSRGGTTAVDIVDDGPGIPPHERERVFEPFVRLDDDSHTIAGRGVGLGLALVKRIVLQHGGRIEVREGTDGGCLMHTEWPNRVRDDVGQGRQWTPVAQPF